ncbi:helix-turn-helix domain-containing protein [Paenibacillus illinoisensis]|uniref:Helix-turn-helix domain-containing protein n=1 Tax=Paenibacillus illinoisensis TaxID=59845 RepID=A0ABW8HYD2_9BACL
MGLRREEVSYLANISVTYYAWLEQGKEVNPSPEVLLSISKALQLDEDEQKHLFDLANADVASVVTVPNNVECSKCSSINKGAVGEINSLLKGLNP